MRIGFCFCLFAPLAFPTVPAGRPPASFVRLAALAAAAAFPVLVTAARCARRLMLPLRLLSPGSLAASFARLRLALVLAFRLPPVTRPLLPPPPANRPFASLLYVLAIGCSAG